LECSLALNLPYIFHEFAESQDVIGWNNFAVGMVSIKCLLIQSSYLIKSKSSAHATRWILGLITQLLQVTHTQWIYQCIPIHDPTTGTLILAHKEDLLREIEHQLTLGPDSLAEEDRFLLECNFGNFMMSTGEQQEYWLLAIQAAQEARRICTEAGATQQSRLGTGQRRALS
jgi:hypothetical protein